MTLKVVQPGLEGVISASGPRLPTDFDPLLALPQEAIPDAKQVQPPIDAGFSWFEPAPDTSMPARVTGGHGRHIAKHRAPTRSSELLEAVENRGSSLWASAKQLGSKAVSPVVRLARATKSAAETVTQSRTARAAAVLGTMAAASAAAVYGRSQLLQGARQPGAEQYQLNDTGPSVIANKILNARGRVPRNYFPDFPSWIHSAAESTHAFIGLELTSAVAGVALLGILSYAAKKSKYI